MTIRLLPVQRIVANGVWALSSQQRTALGFNIHHFHSLLTTTHPSTLTPLTPPPPRHLVSQLQLPVQHRSLASAAASSNTQTKRKDGTKNKSDSENDDTESSSYFARKAAAKAARTAAYQHKLVKMVERRGRRRKQKNHNNDDDSSPTHVLKPAFRQWMDRRVARDERWDRQAKQAQKTWTIRVACLVERLPVVLPDRPEWETAYEDLKAYQDQYGGKQYPPEFLGSAASSTGGGGGGGRANKMPDKPLTDEELLAMLPENYKPAPRETAADADGSVDTLDRRLKDRVYLMFQSDSDGTSSLYFPTTVVKDDESLLEAAQRALQEQMATAKKGGKSKGDDAATTTATTGKPFPLDLYCPSNMPLGVQLEAQNNEETLSSSSDVFGTKTFFIKVQYDDGKLTQKDVGGDKAICWLDRAEIVERMEAALGEEEGKFYQYLL